MLWQRLCFSNGFVSVTKTVALDDEIVIQNTIHPNGPHTAINKVRIISQNISQKYSDTTLVEPVDVIQGHDGSITKAYGDYRDDLILELEKEYTIILKQHLIKI